MEKYKEIIIKRGTELRAQLEKIESNRARLDFLKNYYLGKTAIIVATGPGFKEHIQLIKDNFNENTILICVKQAIFDFDMICDFHTLNEDNYMDYCYNLQYKPIVLHINYGKPNEKNIRYTRKKSDINFFIYSLNNYNKIYKNFFNCVDKNIDSLSCCDENLGIGENMVINGPHIMMEIVLPLAIQIGVKNIITNGWVGGSAHGTDVQAITWEGKYEFMNVEQKYMYDKSKYINKFMHDLFNICWVSISKTNYQIKQVSYDEYIKIVT